MGEKRLGVELKALGAKIREIRNRKNLTQLDIEIICGITRNDISKIEHGLKNVEFHTIVRIAEALEIELIDLFRPTK